MTQGQAHRKFTGKCEMLGWWRPGWKGGRVGFSWPLGRVEGLGWARPGLASAGRLPQGEAEAMLFCKNVIVAKQGTFAKLLEHFDIQSRSY